MNTTIHTYKDIVDYFQQACNEHVAIKHFAEGAIDYLDANSQNIKYPFMFLRPLASPGLSNQTHDRWIASVSKSPSIEHLALYS